MVGGPATGTSLAETHLYTLQKRNVTRVHVLTRTVERHGSRVRPTNFYSHTSSKCPNGPLALFRRQCSLPAR